MNIVAFEANVVKFPGPNRQNKRQRKNGLNQNKEGSVRKVNNTAYVDFIYLGERVRESSGLKWNKQNARLVRQQLDKIILSIKSGEFRFGNVFSNSNRRDYFTVKECQLFGESKTPDQVLFKEHVWIWYDLLKDSGRVSLRTLGAYKGYIDKYLNPFFGNRTFSAINRFVLNEFVAWARKQRYRKKVVGNKSINKYLIPLRMICEEAAIKYDWGNSFNPFFGFKKLPEDDAYWKIKPFSLLEQKKIIDELPDHWKPYFRFAFCSGLRQGEQFALKASDIDWSKKTLHVCRAITRDDHNHAIEGKTKNKYSIRTIRLNAEMLSALNDQKKIYDSYNCKYFFCSTTGNRICPSNLRLRVWIPALEKAGIEYREMRQTRHSFATFHLSCGRNPLRIAKIMGHRDSEMIIKVYGRFIDDSEGVGIDDES